MVNDFDAEAAITNGPFFISRRAARGTWWVISKESEHQRFIREGATIYVQPTVSGACLVELGH